MHSAYYSSFTEGGRKSLYPSAQKTSVYTDVTEDNLEKWRNLSESLRREDKAR